MGKNKKSGHSKNKTQEKAVDETLNIGETTEAESPAIEEELNNTYENSANTEKDVADDRPKQSANDESAATDNNTVHGSQRKRIEELEAQLSQSQEDAANYEIKYNNLLEKISSMKQIFHNMKEAKSELADSKVKIEQLETKLKVSEDTLKNQEALLEEYQNDKILIVHLNKSIEKYEKQLEEINQLNDEKFLNLETKLKTKDTHIKTLTEQLEEYLLLINEDKSAKLGMSDEINNLKNIIQEKNVEISEIKNEYSAHKSDSTSKIDSYIEKIDKLENEKSEINKKLVLSNENADDMKLTMSENKTQIELLRKKVENNIKLEAEVKEKQLLIGKLRHEAIILNEHLTKALDMIKKNKEGNFVDKELISNLVLKFVSLPRGDSKKFEVLSLISSYLDWSNEEKIEAGLVYK